MTWPNAYDTKYIKLGSTYIEDGENLSVLYDVA